VPNTYAINTDIYGVDWEHRKYILEVRPAGQQSSAQGDHARGAVMVLNAPRRVEVMPCQVQDHQDNDQWVTAGGACI
jgi:hypothetical protein